jgi:hypothetical protein
LVAYPAQSRNHPALPEETQLRLALQ